jgi:hypothetical protein
MKEVQSAMRKSKKKKVQSAVRKDENTTKQSATRIDENTRIYQSIHLRSVLVLCLLAFIFFSPFFVDGKAFLAADNLKLFYPWKYYASEDFKAHNDLLTDPVNAFYAETYNKGLKDGNLTQWCPYVLTGIPSLVGTPGTFAPLKILFHRFLPTYAATTLLLFTHLLLMGCFMYWYLFEIGAGWRGALFGAVAYMFNGCVMVWLEFEMWVTVGACLPLLLVSMERYLGKRRLFYAFAGGGVFGLMFLYSSFQLIIYISVFMVLYLGFLMVRAYGRKEAGRGLASLVTCFAVTCITGLLIGAVEIIPFLEAASNSSRMSRTFGFQQLFDTLARVPFRFFVTSFFPDYFGSPVLHNNFLPKLPTQEYINNNELTLYAGVSTVFGFAACMTARKNVFSRYHIFMTLLILAMITGTYAYYPFFKLVPGMNKTNPTRLIFLFVFVFSAAAGLGIKGFQDMTHIRKKIFLGAALLLLTVVSIISFFGNSPEVTHWINKERFDAIPPRLIDKLLEALQNLRSIRSPVIYKPLILTLVAFCLFSLLVTVRKNRITNAVFVLILVLLSYDLMSFGRNYNTTVKPEDVYPKTPAIEFLQKQRGPFRVIQDTDNSLYVNTLIPFGLEEIGGYQSYYPDRVNKLMSYIRNGDKVFTGAILDRWVMFGSKKTDYSLRIFDLMNVRYLLTAPSVEIANKKYKLVFREDLAVYENKDVMPRAFVVHNYVVINNMKQILQYMWSDAFDMKNKVVLEKEPSSELTAGIHAPSYPPQATFEKYTPGAITIKTDLSTRGWLVLSDTYDPGWKAEVDGKETVIRRANYNFRAVEVPAGRHTVSFLYRSPSVYMGMMLTILGVVLSAIGMYTSLRQSGRDKEQEAR